MGLPDLDPPFGVTMGSTSKGSHVWYQIESLKEILYIIQLKWISFTPATIPPSNRVEIDQPVNIVIFEIKLNILMRTLENMTDMWHSMESPGVNFEKVAMFSIKLKFLKRSGRLNNLNKAYSYLTFTPP